MTPERERLAKAICYGLGCRCRMPRCQGEDACVGAADSRNLEAAAFVEAAGFRAPTASEDDMKAARQICEDLSFSYDQESVAIVAVALAAARADARREANRLRAALIEAAGCYPIRDLASVRAALAGEARDG